MTYAEIEKSVIDLLKGSVQVLRLVEPYSGQLEDEIKELALRLPAAFIVHGGSAYTWVDGAVYREQAEVSVLLAQRVTGRAGPGSTVLDAALEALAHMPLGDSAERLVPVSSSLVFTNRLVAVHSLDFMAGFDRVFRNL